MLAERFLKDFSTSVKLGDIKDLSCWQNDAAELLANACSAKNVNNLPIVSITGPQGAGKGTQCEALSTAAKVYNVKRLRIDQGEIKVGTGGICNPPEAGEYAALFGWMKEISQTYVQRGELVPQELVNTSVVAMMAKRVEEGAEGIFVDGWPRNEAQLAYSQVIKGRWDVLNPRIVELRILSPEVVDALVKNPADVAERMKCFGSSIADGRPDVNNVFYSEYQIAMARAAKRFFETGRSDDKPETLNRRLKIYYQESGPAIWRAFSEGELSMSVVSSSQGLVEVQTRFQEAIETGLSLQAVGLFAQSLMTSIKK
jgi:adenylate kinase family enzyme